MDNYSLLLDSQDSSTLSLTLALEREEEEEDEEEGGVRVVREGTLLTDVSSGVTSLAQKMQLAGTKSWKSIGSYLAGGNPAEEKASLLSQSQSHQSRLGYTGLPCSTSDADLPDSASASRSSHREDAGGRTNSGWDGWSGDDWGDNWGSGAKETKTSTGRTRAKQDDDGGWSNQWDTDWDTGTSKKST